MSQTRDETIRNRLAKMTGWAEERRRFMADHRNELKEDWHIRIGGKGYTAVSLDCERPLLGFVSGPTTNIRTAVSHFHNKPRNKPGRPTPEKCAQAWLIKQAVNNRLNLKTCLGLDGSIYDKLLFALDELSFGDRNQRPIERLDILAVGIVNGKAFPVFIELKSERSLGRLITQLDTYQKQVKRYECEVKELLHACTNNEVDLSEYGRIMVWPKRTSDRRSDGIEAECAKHKVTVIESDTDSWIESDTDSWKCIRDFSFHPLNNKVYPPTPYIGES